MAKDWVRENSAELAKDFYSENYDEAVSEFTLGRLQSYYLAQAELAVPAVRALQYAQSLMPRFHQGALVFAVTATELTVKNVLLRPIISGLVHSEDLASLIADLTTDQAGMDRFHKLLTGILSQYGGFQLKSFKRVGSVRTLWEEMFEVQKARNGLIHRGDPTEEATAGLSIDVAHTLLVHIFPTILTRLGLHIHTPLRICGQAH
jgi:hypothetical protein